MDSGIPAATVNALALKSPDKFYTNRTVIIYFSNNQYFKRNAFLETRVLFIISMNKAAQKVPNTLRMIALQNSMSQIFTNSYQFNIEC
jgi:hypothetical protein